MVPALDVFGLGAALCFPLAIDFDLGDAEVPFFVIGREGTSTFIANAEKSLYDKRA